MKESYYKKLLDAANDLIWIVDMEGKFIYINDKIKEWGYDNNKLIGQPLLSILDTKHINKRQTELSALGIRKTYEMEILDKLGNVHIVAISSSPLHDEKENIIGIMGIIRDITETRELEEKLKNEERLASLGRLAAGIAHEIRNPLSSVKMNIAILRKNLKPRGTDIEHFKIAQDEVANLERIVTELLDYAKPSPLRLRKEDVHETIESTLEVVKAACRQSSIIVKKSFTKDLPRISMDKNKIQQAILNILLNAIQASKSGDTIEVKTEDNPVSNSIKIIVIDHGHGIEEKNKNYIFDPFFTTKTNGTGLGLSIVRNIIKNHDGAILLDSVVGVGTEVCIYLPL